MGWVEGGAKRATGNGQLAVGSCRKDEEEEEEEERCPGLSGGPSRPGQTDRQTERQKDNKDGM